MTKGRASVFLEEGRPDRAALFVFLVALGLRLGWVIYVRAVHPEEGYYLTGDAQEYTAVAGNLLSGKGWWSPDHGGTPYFEGPVFPLFLACILGLGGNLFTVTLVQAAVGAATC
jgi:hypothetical protein